MDCPAEASLPIDLLLWINSEGERLFENATDLANQIVKIDPARYKDLSSVQSSLSPVLNLKRPCNANLRNVILQVVNDRLLSRGHFPPGITERLNALLEYPDWPTIRCDRADFTTLLRETQQCASLVAVVHDAVLSDYSGQQILRTVLKRIQLGDCNFTFLFPNQQNAVHFWRTLILQLAEVLTPEDARRARDLLSDLEKGGAIRVLQVPEEICLLPSLILNPKDEGKATGFYLDLFAPGVASLSRMSRESIGRWLRSIYLRISLSQYGVEVPLESAIASDLRTPEN